MTTSKLWLLAKFVVPVPADVTNVTGKVTELFGTTVGVADTCHF
jgi:hypothetical protein